MIWNVARAKNEFTYLLCGYGQMFLSNNVVSGGLFLLGLLIASPWNGFLSLVGATIVTLLGMQLAKNTSEIKNGLFGINGVLLGYVWVFFPEVPFWQSAVLTAVGAMMIAFLLAGCLTLCRKRKWTFAFFSTPYVLVAWLALGLLHSTQVDDLHLFAGWHSLAEKEIAQAEAAFSAAQPTSVRARAFQHNGLGWVAFQQFNFATAREHFQQATELAPDLADPHDGLGWCAFKLWQYDVAEQEFRESLARDAGLADSWLGRGWLALREDNVAKARTCFERAAWSAPLCGPAFDGLTQCYSGEGREELASWSRAWAEFIARHLGTRFQFLSGRQLLCWLLFGLGILWHSRISFVAAGGAITTCFLGARMFPDLAATFGDVHFAFNLIATFIVLSGLYLQLNAVTLGWLFLVTVGMTLGWHGCSGHVFATGLPLLCVPVNVVLALTTFLFGRFPKSWPKRQAIPFEFAVTSPEQVRLWLKKCTIAEKCWEKIAASRRR